MKLLPNKLILLAGAFSLAAAFTLPVVRAEETTDAPKPKKVHKYSAKTLEKYDTNKDGQLDKDEKAAMKADKAKMKEERAARKAKKAGGDDAKQEEQK